MGRNKTNQALYLGAVVHKNEHPFGVGYNSRPTNTSWVLLLTEPIQAPSLGGFQPRTRIKQTPLWAV